MLCNSLATLEGEQDFISFYRDLLTREFTPLSLFVVLFAQNELSWWKSAILSWYKIGQDLCAHFDPKNWKIGPLFTFFWIFSLFREFACIHHCDVNTILIMKNYGITLTRGNYKLLGRQRCFRRQWNGR